MKSTKILKKAAQAPSTKSGKGIKFSVMHFFGFAAGFLVILGIALSVFTYTSALGS